MKPHGLARTRWGGRLWRWLDCWWVWRADWFALGLMLTPSLIVAHTGLAFFAGVGLCSLVWWLTGWRLARPDDLA
jgi:hypothetical protein